jgi:hypothetical protein
MRRVVRDVVRTMTIERWVIEDVELSTVEGAPATNASNSVPAQPARPKPKRLNRRRTQRNRASAKAY